jgi:hypothetical protein
MAIQNDSARAGQAVAAEMLAPPGGYGDGPVHIRVDIETAGTWRSPSGHSVEINDWRCKFDPRFDYVEVVNSHNAFLYLDDMIRAGVRASALSVVRIPPADEVES